MNPEIRTAARWYLWLWLSPLLTIPTAIVAAVSLWLPVERLRLALVPTGQTGYSMRDAILVTLAIAVSALWHLVLLRPALGGRSEFVRWHGCQALLLAVLRTLVPAGVLVYLVSPGGGIGGLWGLPAQILLWAGGTAAAQAEASRGECSLMRRVGRGAGLPLPRGEAQAAARGPAAEPHLLRPTDEPPSGAAAGVEAPAGPAAEAQTSESLLELIRFSNDPARRREALAELQRRGWAEPL